MSRRNLCASILAACLLAAGLGGLAPAAGAAPAGQSLLNAGDSAKSSVIEIRKRGRGHDGYGYRHRPRFYVRPIGPSYTYYDYPYYFSRGYYPTHIGPGILYTAPGDYDDEVSYASDEAIPFSAKERCERRFKSFEWDSGLYTTYGGQKKLCPYLR